MRHISFRTLLVRVLFILRGSHYLHYLIQLTIIFINEQQFKLKRGTLFK